MLRFQRENIEHNHHEKDDNYQENYHHNYSEDNYYQENNHDEENYNHKTDNYETTVSRTNHVVSARCSRSCPMSRVRESV